MAWFSRLCFPLIFLQFHFASPFTDSPTPLCHSEERAALIQFRSSFSVDDYKYSSSKYVGAGEPNSTASWDSGDCCTWRGVTCHPPWGHVIELHLQCGGLRGVLDSNNSLFALVHLRILILSHNDFDGSAISPEFGKFTRMVHLDLSYSNFAGRVPAELAFMSDLVVLDLRKNPDLIVESSSLKRIVANLTRLEKLFLSYVNMSNVVPNSFMNLSSHLTSLDLTQSGLSGEFPENIFSLENLTGLRLDYNKNLFGSFPKNNWKSSLYILGLSETGFMIDLGNLTRALNNLTALYVNKCKFKEPFPALLRKLEKVHFLGLASNHFGGQIPWQNLNLELLSDLDLSSNYFVGQIPELCRNSVGNSSLCDPSNNQLVVGCVPLHLKSLKLSHNNFTGKIPSWIYSLPHLEELSLSHNNFIGGINEFRSLSLTVLQLRTNKLEGPIPTSIFEQRNLSYLDLSKNNLIGVVTFQQVSKLEHLQVLGLSYNKLSLVSTVDDNYTMPSTLSKLCLSKCNITEFPYSLRSAEHLEILDLSINEIQGSVPEWLWSVGKNTLYNLNISYNKLTHVTKIPWSKLQLIDLDCNLLHGTLPNPPNSTILYSTSNNDFSGNIPSWVCNLTSIQVLNLSNNKLSGIILPCLGNVSKYLSVLDLRMNSLHGMIPKTFAKGNSLMTLNLAGNRLEGLLHHSLLNCKSLQVLDVRNNSLSGPFPQWLEKFKKLQVLVLASNRFQGPISRHNPKVRSPFKMLRILDLSDNSFSGPLPEEYFENFEGMKTSHARNLKYMEKQVLGKFFYRDSMSMVIKGFYTQLVKIQTELVIIDCSGNKFTGEIPQVVGNLHMLKGLNLAQNKLRGELPESLGNLTNLEALDLSFNRLTGKIPEKLAKITQIGFLNLSFNNLEGRVPQGPQFATFQEAFFGNPKLCGFPLPRPCKTDDGKVHKKEGDGISHWDVMMTGYASGVVIGLSVGYILFFNPAFDRRLEEGWRKYANKRM